MHCCERLAIALAILSMAACSSREGAAPPAGGERVRLWHTFSSFETETLNQVLLGRDDVEVTMISFARGHLVLRHILAASEPGECPDLVRIDASWLPALAPYLKEAPSSQPDGRTWLPEAVALATVNGVMLALPQSLDGLALIARRSVVDGDPRWPPRSYGELTAMARALARDRDFGIDLRFDAFWFVPFLRAGGADLLDPRTGELRIDHSSAVASLEGFARLFGDLAPRPGAAGSDFREEVRRFRDGRVALVIEGPWAIAGLAEGDPSNLAIAPMPSTSGGAPSAAIGGQLFVVPRCGTQTTGAWELAAELTSPAVQAAWSRRFGTIPTTREALADGGPTASAFYAALAGAQPLPRHAVTPDLFDDLTPAIAAVVAGDATAAEALAGVERAWGRLRRRHGIPIPEASDSP